MRCSLAESAAKAKLEEGAKALDDIVPALMSEDVEGIHRARVASRRLRAAIDAHRSVLGKRERNLLTKAVRRITSGLGTARELDVTIALLESKRMGLSGAERYACTHAVTQLRALRNDEAKAIAASADYIMSDAFANRVYETVSSGRAPNVCHLDEAEAELKGRRRDLWRAHKQWGQSPSEENLHAVRIAFKKFRYSCEQYVDLYGKPLKRLTKTLRVVQDDLGTWNDFRVARRRVQSVSNGAEPMAASGIAPLAALLDQEADKHLDAYRSTAAEFFSPTQRDGVKRLIKAARRPCCAKRKKG